MEKNAEYQKSKAGNDLTQAPSGQLVALARDLVELQTSLGLRIDAANHKLDRLESLSTGGVSPVKEGVDLDGCSFVDLLKMIHEKQNLALAQIERLNGELRRLFD